MFMFIPRCVMASRCHNLSKSYHLECQYQYIVYIWFYQAPACNRDGRKRYFAFTVIVVAVKITLITIIVLVHIAKSRFPNKLCTMIGVFLLWVIWIHVPCSKRPTPDISLISKRPAQSQLASNWFPAGARCSI